MKLVYDLLETRNHRFALYYLYYKEKLEITLMKFAHNIFVLATA